MQYMIKAYDYENGLDRRMAVRPQHLENIKKIKDYGSVVSAGGLLDEQGQMKGSFLVLEFESKELLDKYLESEPYISEKVWEKVEIEVCNTVIINDEIVRK